MKSVHRLKTLVPVAIGLAILILDSKTAIEGAAKGLNLCLNSVIPSLFPFIFLSSLLTASLLSGEIKGSDMLCKLYGIPHGSAGILLTGLLGGYPVGAKCIGDALQEGQLTAKEAEQMLVFCNATGPAFLFGIISNLFVETWIPWCLWCIHLLSGLCIAQLKRTKMTSRHLSKYEAPRSPSISQRLRQSIKVMGDICGWIILMRIVITFIEKWFLWRLPETSAIFILGILELTNGCIELQNISSTRVRFILCATLLSFGGICVTLQTSSVAPTVNHRKYIIGKCIQAAISFIFAYILQYIFCRTNYNLHLWSLFVAICIVILGVFAYSYTIKKKVVEI